MEQNLRRQMKAQRRDGMHPDWGVRIVMLMAIILMATGIWAFSGGCGTVGQGSRSPMHYSEVHQRKSIARKARRDSLRAVKTAEAFMAGLQKEADRRIKLEQKAKDKAKKTLK